MRHSQAVEAVVIALIWSLDLTRSSPVNALEIEKDDLSLWTFQCPSEEF